jgi:hypothetical protein
MDIVFRKFKEGDVIALMCGTGPDCNAGNVMSYQHIGQHGEASVMLGRSLKLATPEEYEPLLRELRRIYAPEPVNPVKRLYVNPTKERAPRSYPAKSVLQARLSENAVECFYVSADEARRQRYDNARRAKEYGHDIPNAGTPSAGWYFRTCVPGCLPDSDPFGPYASPLAVLRAAYDADFLPDPINEQGE